MEVMMRMRRNTGTILLILGITVAGVPAAAEPILVLGRMTYDAAVDSAPRRDLVPSERGFSLRAVPAQPQFGPRCTGDCAPGDRVSIRASWSDHDLPGIGSLDGATFPLGFGSTVEGSALVDFNGPMWTVPAFNGALTTTVAVPITFSGLIRPPTPEGQNPLFIPLVSSGLATLALSWNAPSEGWSLSGASYELQAAPAPVPEPATLVLVGSGFAAAVWKRRRRQRVDA
jgi:hypothetical protein